MNTDSIPVVITALGTLLTALLTGVALIIGNREKGKVSSLEYALDVEKTISARYKEESEAQQERNEELRQENDRLIEELSACKNNVFSK